MASTIERFKAFFDTKFDIRFNDEKLETIARDVEKSVDETGTEIAQYLARNFSINYINVICGNSKKLLEKYSQTILFYDNVTQALGDGEDIENVKKVKKYLKGTSAYAGALKTRQIEMIKFKALLSHDVILSFSSQFDSFQLPRHALAQELFNILNPSNPEISQFLHTTGHFFQIVCSVKKLRNFRI